MKIAINGRFLARPVTGIERHGREVLRALDALISDRAPCVEDTTFTIFEPARHASDVNFTNLDVVQVGRFSGHIWEQFELPFAANSFDALLNFCNFTPLIGRTPSVTCIHDAHVWQVPENFRPLFRALYKIGLPAVGRATTAWTTVSEFSAAELMKHRVATSPPDAITPNGHDHVLGVEASRPKGLAPDQGRFVFALGSASINKNIALVERIAPSLAQMGLTVVVAGGSNSSVFSADSNPVGGVERIGRVDDSELIWLYQNAEAFLFPSKAEGFGIPAVEAMALGCPVVSSNSTAMPEVIGNAGILCSPNDDSDWIRACKSLEIPSIRSHYVNEGRRRAASYSWSNIAETYIRIAKSVAKQ